jgi:ABC-2 type transport system permease protein
VRIFRALVRKEFLQIGRDPSAIAIAFVLPLILLFIFGYGISLDSGRVRLGVVAEGDGPQNRAILMAFANNPRFDARAASDRRDLVPDLAAGRVRGLVIVPWDIERRADSGLAPEVMVIADGTESNSANFVGTYARGVLGQSYGAERLAALGIMEPAGLISPEPRFWYNPELSSRNFIIPGSLSIVMTLIGVLLTALVISREWERGTMESLMSTPVGIGQIVLAKLAAYYILAMLATFMCWLAAVYFFNVPFRGSLHALAAVSTVFLVTALGQGLLISTVARDQYLASQVAIVLGFLPSFFLSGFIFELASMPDAVRAVSRLVPARYFVTSLQTVFLVGDVWPLFLGCGAAMAAIGAALFLVTLKMLRKKVA